MIEEEYLFIRKMENDHRNVLRQISDLDTTKTQNLVILHEDLVNIIETIQDTINNKKVKSLRALEVLEQMKVGFIEMLSQVDTLLS
jgi:hypothetical protein